MEAHHFTELKNFIREGEPFHGGNCVDGSGEKGHNFKVTANDAFDFWMEDFNGDIGGRDSLRSAFNEDVNILAHTLAQVGWIGIDIIVAEGREVRLELRFVNLSYGAYAQRLLLKLVEDVFKRSTVECFDNCSFGRGKGVGWGVGVERRHAIAHLLREYVCS